MPVTLIIKSAAQNVEDFTLNCESDWTIGKVKDQISILYPTKPQREHQKLIYGGKLLPDHLPLESALNKMQDVHIVHIVCPFPAKTDSEKPSESKEKSTVPPAFTALPANPVYTQMNQPLLSPQGLTR
ncbi:Homocysteine-responsive endoplasmic reticulum-resident ubiquitin-like domain member 2 protein, partial [Stegodyphus mimosarum]